MVIKRGIIMNKNLKRIFMLFTAFGVIALIMLPAWIMISLIIFQLNNVNPLDLYEWLVATYIVLGFSLFVYIYLFYRLIFIEGKESKKE